MNEVAVPSISVLITTYNAESVLGRALESLQGDRGDIAEVIVVDDGSSDDTLAVAERYADRLPLRVVAIGRRGRAVALNTGIDASSSDLIAILDADDAAVTGRMAIHQAAFSRDPKLGIHGGSFVLATRTEARRRDMPQSDADIRRALTYMGPFCHSTVAYRRSALVKAGGFRPGLRSRIDQDLWIRIASVGYHLENSSSILGVHYKGSDTYFSGINTPGYRAGSMLLRNFTAVRLLQQPRYLYAIATVRSLVSLLPSSLVEKVAPGTSSPIDPSDLRPQEIEALSGYLKGA